MEDSRAISPFRCDRIETNKLAREWKAWKESLECNFAAYDMTDQKVMRAKMLHLYDPALQTVFKNLKNNDYVPLVAIISRWYDIAVEKLGEFFEPRHKSISERRKRTQRSKILVRDSQILSSVWSNKLPNVDSKNMEPKLKSLYFWRTFTWRMLLSRGFLHMKYPDWYCFCHSRILKRSKLLKEVTIISW